MTRGQANTLEADQPSVEPELPEDALADRVQDFFKTRYRGILSRDDAAWLGALVGDFLRNQGDLISESSMRAACSRMLAVLLEIDQQMTEAGDPYRRWCEISLSLGLPSSGEFTGNSLARKSGLTKMAISKSVARLRVFFNVQPAFDQHGNLANLTH